MCCSNVFKVCFCSSLGSHADLFVCVVFRLLMFTLGLFLSFRWDRRQTLVTIVASQVMKNQGLIKKMQMFHPHPGRKARSPLRRPAKKTKVATTVATMVATMVVGTGATAALGVKGWALLLGPESGSTSTPVVSARRAHFSSCLGPSCLSSDGSTQSRALKTNS